MMKCANHIAAAWFFGLTTAAGAQSLDMLSKAESLGTILASEEFCGLSYDQAAIRSWIEKNIPAGEMAFPSYLQSGVASASFQLQGMTASAKTAHCSAVAQTARFYGFTK